MCYKGSFLLKILFDQKHESRLLILRQIKKENGYYRATSKDTFQTLELYQLWQSGQVPDP